MLIFKLLKFKRKQNIYADAKKCVNTFVALLAIKPIQYVVPALKVNDVVAVLLPIVEQSKSIYA